MICDAAEEGFVGQIVGVEVGGEHDHELERDLEFHAVAQRQVLYQQTRGTLAMLAQWISWAFDKQHKDQTNEPLLTLGSAPLHVPGFRGAVLGQIGESRLVTAIDSDIATGRPVAPEEQTAPKLATLFKVTADTFS